LECKTGIFMMHWLTGGGRSLKVGG